MPQDKIISWQAPEFRHYPKNFAWYLTAGTISLAVVGFFVLERDFFAAISLTIVACFALIFAGQKPETVDISLRDKGISYGGIFLPYKQIKHFWLVENQTHRTINLHTSAWLNHLVILEIGQQDSEPIRKFLAARLPEHEETEATTAQKIMHRLKF